MSKLAVGVALIAICLGSLGFVFALGATPNIDPPTFTEILLDGVNVLSQYYRLVNVTSGTGDLYLFKYYGNLFLSNSPTSPGTSLAGLYAGTVYFKIIRTFTTTDLIFQTYDSTWKEVARMYRGANYRFEISRSGDITPYSDKTVDVGSSSERYSFLFGETWAYNTTTYAKFDSVNDRYLFYIDGSCVGFINATGFHNGSP